MLASLKTTPREVADPIEYGTILGMRINSTCYADAVRQIMDWASRRQSRYVCVANVHSVMEGYDSLGFQEAVNRADLITSDGVPLVWALRSLNLPNSQRVYGPDLTLRLLAEAERECVPVGFYGGSADVLQALGSSLTKRFPNLRIVYSVSPPFRALSEDENDQVVEAINSSGVRILFVGLGCPKQERWMAENHGKIWAAMVGVGAAFDFLAGSKRQAPRWMMRTGLEWLFRLATEPRRLWRRYLKNNPRFVILFCRQWLRQMLSPVGTKTRKAH